MKFFSFSPPICLVEECKLLLAVSSSETINSVVNLADENNSFSINIPKHWDCESAEETIDEINKLLEFRSQNRVELHVKEVRKRGKQTEIGEYEFKLSLFDTQKNEITTELKNVEYNDLEDMVFRKEVTYHEVAEKLDTKYIAPTSIRYALQPGIKDISDSNLMLKSLKVDFTIDGIRLI